MWIIKKLIINILHMLSVVISMRIIEGKKIKLNIYLVSVIWISTILMLSINIFFSVHMEIKAVLSLIIFSFLYSRIYKKKMYEGISISFITIFLFFILEVLFSLYFVFINIDPKSVSNEFNIMFLINIILGVSIIFVVSRKILLKGIRRIIDLLNKKIILHLFFILLLMMGIIIKRGISSSTHQDYFMNLILILMFLYLIYLIYKEKTNLENLSEKQDILYNYILNYESELNEKNKIIHEFKNQLLTINGFLDTNIDKTKLYLKDIINDIKDKDNKLISNLNKIPKGGLKGLFYYKLSNLEKNININLIIGKKIKLIENLNITLYKNILKILGVYLDNAIEAANNSAEKVIEIEIYEEKNKINFLISNTFDNTPNIIKENNKGKNRGYGLLLVRDILNKNKNILSSFKIVDNYYIVELTIEILN